MLKTIILPAALLLSALLTLGACQDRPPESAPPNIESPNIESAPAAEPLVMGYGRDWSSPDCNSVFGRDLPPGTRICAVLSAGQRPDSGLVLDRREPHKSAGLVTVQVNSPDAPVALLLYDHNSTLWRIETTPGTEVAAAAANGYGPQAISGLKPETARIINYYGQGHRPCGRFSGNAPRVRQELTEYLRQNLGLEPDFIAETVEGRAVCGWPVPPGAELLSHEDFKPEEFEAFAGLMNRLDEDLASGRLRPARYRDLKAFKEARSMDGHLFIDEQGWELLPDAYVVLSPDFVFPELDEPGDRQPERVFTFLIPPGLALPQGPLKGLRVLFLDDGSCLGAKCGHGAGLYQASGRPKPPPPDLKLPPECRFEGLNLPEEAKIYAGGAHEGRRTDREAPEPEAKDGSYPVDIFSGVVHRPPPLPRAKSYWGRMEVTVNSPGSPVVLMLGAYNPTEWHLDISPGTEVAAVALSGYHRQRLLNPPAGTPVISGGRDEGRCWSFHFSRSNFARINDLSENLFGRAPDRGFTAVDGRLVIDPSRPPRAAAPPDSAPPRGTDNAALAQAEFRGLIGPASPETKRAWYKKHMENKGLTNLMDPADYVYNPPYPAYEILSEEFRFTEKMAGAELIDFYLPENMNPPAGRPGRFTIHYLDSGLCRGARPNCGHSGD